jgi:hypothetical protein
MGEQQSVIAELRASGVLAAIRWAYESAVRRSLETYCEADGHDHAWLGHTRFTLFRDRLDRVFACVRYAVGVADGAPDLDVLYAELSEDDLATMPRLAPGTVSRDDLFGSAGWTFRGRRFLLAAGEFGRLDTLPWADRSTTKQLVATQANPDPHLRQPSLFEDLPPDVASGLDAALRAAQRRLNPVTYIVAHSLDAATGQIELVFGRPMLNLRGEDAWHWRENLLAVPLVAAAPAQASESPSSGGTGTAAQPTATADTQPGTEGRDGGARGVPDAPVRLRVIKGELLGDSG